MHASKEELVHLHIGLPLLEESAASAIVSSDCMYVPYRHMQEMTAGILFSSADIHHFQIIWHGGSLQLRVVTPKAQALLTKSIILAMQLGAQLTEVSSLLPTNSEQAEIVATTLTYEKSSIFPIRYSNEITGEPIHYLLQAFGTLPSDVSVIAQLSTMPASAPTWFRIRQTAAAFYQRSAGWLAPKYWKNKELREAEDAAIQKKSTGEYGLAELSIGAFVDENYLRNHSRTNAKDRLAKAMKIATEAYSAFARPDINAVIPKSLVYGYTALRKLQPGGRLKGRHSMIMNDFEIASLWSIPKELRSTKLVHSLGKELPIPTDFLKFSNVHDFLKIGENGYRGRTASFGIAQDARDHHLLIHGTESNETISLAYELLAQDFTSQRPIALLTESKLFFEQVTQLATNTAPQQLLFLDFLNGTASCQLNLFDLIGRDEGEGKVLLTNVFKATFGERWTCEVHELFTNSCDRLFSLPYSSLLDIEALLAVEEAQLGMLNDSIPTAANKIASSENARNELLAIVSELLEDDTVQCVFGNPLCALNFQTFIRDGGQIFILLPRYEESPTRFAFILHFWLHLLMRTKQQLNSPYSLQTVLSLYTDSMHRASTDTVQQTVSDARKSRISLTVINNDLQTFSENSRQNLFGSIANGIFFQTSRKNAESIQKELGAPISVDDITSLPLGNFFAKLLLNGKAQQVFSGRLVHDHKCRDRVCQDRCPTSEELQCGQCIRSRQELLEVTSRWRALIKKSSNLPPAKSQLR